MRISHISRIAACFAAILSMLACSLLVPTPSNPTGMPLINEPTGEIPGWAEIRFLNLLEGGSVAATLDDTGKGFVLVQVEVTGSPASVVFLEQDGFGVESEAMNPGGLTPFIAEIAWYPIRGGGEYTLVAHALLEDKSEITTTVHVMVTGIAELPPTPPPLDETGARVLVSELIQEEFGIIIPQPAVYRFDSSHLPQYSRWIGSAWYDGMRYYVDVYDDTHFAWSSGPYSDPDHIDAASGWTYCKPTGHYKILVLFVDYENLLGNPQGAIDAVPQVADWMNDLYRTYAASLGLAEAPLLLEAEGAFAGPPPTPGELLTVDQVFILTGKLVADYDLIMEIDMDSNVTFAEKNFPGVVSTGGGLALQGCGPTFFGAINIYSTLGSEGDIIGGLVMDFNHELSHLFGMVDNWVFLPAALTTPGGQPADDWIPYPLLGWNDVDGDGVMELMDDTPYGTGRPPP